MLQVQYSERGTQPTPASQTSTAWEQATWPCPSGFYGAGMSALIGSPSFNLSDYVDTTSQQSTQLNTSGTRSTASAATGSAAQLQATQIETHSAREDVTDTDPDGLIDMPSGLRKTTGNEPGDPSY